MSKQKAGSCKAMVVETNRNQLPSQMDGAIQTCPTSVCQPAQDFMIKKTSGQLLGTFRCAEPSTRYSNLYHWEFCGSL
eukprot:2407829-Amphidinium_carterae.3